MGKLTFEFTESQKLNREAKSISLDVPDDMNIHEYKIVCTRLAAAMGFSHTSIEKSFGNLIYGDTTKEELKQLLTDIKKTNPGGGIL